MAFGRDLHQRGAAVRFVSFGGDETVPLKTANQPAGGWKRHPDGIRQRPDSCLIGPIQDDQCPPSGHRQFPSG
jgi:hypothetical protein